MCGCFLMQFTDSLWSCCEGGDSAETSASAKVRSTNCSSQTCPPIPSRLASAVRRHRLTTTLLQQIELRRSNLREREFKGIFATEACKKYLKQCAYRNPAVDARLCAGSSRFLMRTTSTSESVTRDSTAATRADVLSKTRAALCGYQSDYVNDESGELT